MLNKFEIQPHPIFMTPRPCRTGAKSGIPGWGPGQSQVGGAKKKVFFIYCSQKEYFKNTLMIKTSILPLQPS